MFSVIIPGRPCLTDIMAVDSQVNPTKFTFTFPLNPQFSELAVFYLPGTILPQDTAAAVYIQLPDGRNVNPFQAQQPPEFKFLGALTNDEPSAIFRVRNPSVHYGQRRRTEAEEEDEMLDEGAANGPGGASVDGTVTLGIAIEPFQVVAPQVAQLKAAAESKPSTDLMVQPQQLRQQKQTTTKELAQRIIGNAFNYLASFASSDNDSVPLKTFRDWWNKFERKLEMDPTFLEKGEVNA